MTQYDSEAPPEVLVEEEVDFSVDLKAGEAGLVVAIDRHSHTTMTATSKATQEDGLHINKAGKEAGNQTIILLRPPATNVGR